MQTDRKAGTAYMAEPVPLTVIRSHQMASCRRACSSKTLSWRESEIICTEKKHRAKAVVAI